MLEKLFRLVDKLIFTCDHTYSAVGEESRLYGSSDSVEEYTLIVIYCPLCRRRKKVSEQKWAQIQAEQRLDSEVPKSNHW